MPWLDFFVNSKHDWLINIMMPKFHLIPRNSDLRCLFRAQFYCVWNRESVCSHGRSWSSHRLMPLLLWFSCLWFWVAHEAKSWSRGGISVFSRALKCISCSGILSIIELPSSSIHFIILNHGHEIIFLEASCLSYWRKNWSCISIVPWFMNSLNRWDLLVVSHSCVVASFAGINWW